MCLLAFTKADGFYPNKTENGVCYNEGPGLNECGFYYRETNCRAKPNCAWIDYNSKPKMSRARTMPPKDIAQKREMAVKR